jgi:DNA-binding beta-propeller fold protein YncE
MDARQFDALSRALSTPDSRRRVLSLLAILPVLGRLLAPLDDAAAKPGKRRKSQGKPGNDVQNQGDRNKSKNRKKKQKSKECDPRPREQTCAGKCGSVLNNCKKRVNCGTCDCDAGCPVCQVCQRITGACMPDPAQVGDGCGEPGQVCRGDGECGCDAHSCLGCCQDDTCVEHCPDCQICDAGQCVPCPGCCNGTGCHDGDTDDVCGKDGGTCVACPAEEMCVGGGCTCRPTTCEAQGTTCGSIPDGCDGTLQCGDCDQCTICDAGQCRTCPGCCDGSGRCQDGDTNAACGLSGAICAVCTGRDACVDGACVCQPKSCETERKNCGTIPDGCGGALQCGACGNPAPICTDNVCVACRSDSDCASGVFCCEGNCIDTCGPSCAGWNHQVNVVPPRHAFPGPVGIAVSSDGQTMWVPTLLGSDLSVWRRSHRNSTDWREESWIQGYLHPDGIAVSRDELTVWATNAGSGYVAVWHRPDASGTDWRRMTSFGTFGKEPAQLRFPKGIAVSPDGLTAYVADSSNNRISIWMRSNTRGTDWRHVSNFGGHGRGPTQLHHPTGIALSGDGREMLIADSDNHRISVWWLSRGTTWIPRTTFGIQGKAPDEFWSPRGVAFTPRELQVVVADSSNSRISVWTRPTFRSLDWTWETNFADSGAFGRETNQLGYPSGVAATGVPATVWVADPSNARVSIWRFGCPR